MKLYFRLAAGGIRRNSRLYVPYIMTCSLWKQSAQRKLPRERKRFFS